MYGHALDYSTLRVFGCTHMLNELNYQLSLLCVSFWDMVLVKRDIVVWIQLVKNCMSHIMLWFYNIFHYFLFQ